MSRKTDLVSDRAHQARRILRAGTLHGVSRLRLFGYRCAGICYVRVCVATPVSGGARGIWLAHWRKRKDYSFAPCSKIIIYVSFFNETHGGSSRPVAYLKGARLERSMDAGGEEE